jgi:hypothetical protein
MCQGVTDRHWTEVDDTFLVVVEFISTLDRAEMISRALGPATTEFGDA